MQPRNYGVAGLLLLLQVAGIIALADDTAQTPLEQLSRSPKSTAASVSLFASLERLARLVDISYCIGTTGVRKPFDCVSRCKEFPNLSLATTWSTGMLLKDSCGYIAVDDGDGKGDDKLADSNGGAIVVAFRGTYSIANTIVDLSSIPQKYSSYPTPDDGAEEPPPPGGHKHECTNCTVHTGFLGSWQNARKLVLPELKALKAQYPSYPIHLVGHSLGGAVACLAALELKVSLGWDDTVVTTFGEPRVGNHEFARFVDKVFNLDGEENLEKRSYRRVTHKNDPIPLLPLEEWGYMPHAGEVFISKENLSPSVEDLHLCVGDSDPSCSEGADSPSVSSDEVEDAEAADTAEAKGNDGWLPSFPTRFKLWQLFFAHRDYFWRLGLCVPGGDPADWWREKYEAAEPGEL